MPFLGTFFHFPAFLKMSHRLDSPVSCTALYCWISGFSNLTLERKAARISHLATSSAIVVPLFVNVSAVLRAGKLDLVQNVLSAFFTRRQSRHFAELKCWVNLTTDPAVQDRLAPQRHHESLRAAVFHYYLCRQPLNWTGLSPPRSTLCLSRLPSLI